MKSPYPKSIFHILLFLAVLASLLGSAVFVTPARAAGTCYVNDDASGLNDGTDWTNAYADLQDALADSCTEIWVAAGTYKPDASDRSISFALETGTAIYGGFDGTETLLTQRDPVANITILSGDLSGDDSGINNASNASYSENSYHVVFADGSVTPITDATLDGFTITGGRADGGGQFNGGGMRNDYAEPTLTNLIFSNNYAGTGGGGLLVYVSNAPTLTNVTFSGNTANQGGGLWMSASSAILTNVTFSGNSADGSGGGMYNFYLDPVLTNVTFSGNSAGLNGGGMYNVPTTGEVTTLTNVTFSGNSAAGLGGGLYNDGTSGGTALLKNVIIADSTGGDCVNDSTSLDAGSSNNLIEDASNACGLTDGSNGDIVGFDPNLDALADNGGATQTFALLAGSPALDAGTNTGCTATDQRGVSRPQNSTCEIGAYEVALQSGSTRTVTKLADTNGFCDVFNCSLRDAIASTASGNTITFDSSLSGGTITLTIGTLNILTNMTIDGSALASKITINGNYTLRIFLVGGGVTATLNSLIVTQGRWDSDGGGSGVRNNGTLTITNSLFSANTNDNQDGGAILNTSTGNLTVTGSTFSNNSAYHGGAIANYNQLTVANSTFTDNGGGSTDSGGAIYTDGDPGTLTQITNSTFSNNSANLGGALWSSRTQTITNSTFSGNIANSDPDPGYTLYQDGETLNYANNIIADPVNGGCHRNGTLGTNINNLVQDDSNCAATLSGDPLLGTLGNHGGPTQTFDLQPGSPAINAGDNDVCDDNPGPNNLDQRGVARPNGEKCDLGAYEHVDTGAPNVTAFNATDATTLSIPVTTFTASDDGVVTSYLITGSSSTPNLNDSGWTASAPTSFTVTTTGSHTLYPWAKDDAGNISTVYGSPDTVNVCFPSITVTNTNDSGAGSLRQAIADACDGATINFANPGLSGATINLDSTLDISKSLTIDGSNLASTITISGDTDPAGPTPPDGVGDVRIFHITDVPLISVTFDSLILTKGQSSNGGAIFNERALTVKNSILSNNSSSGSGGAITAGYALTVIDSTFSGNSSTSSSGGGGAILGNNLVTISGSTFSNNTADANTGSGGAVWSAGGPSAIINSTFSSNSAGSGGAITTSNGGLTITNSTISGNSAVLTGGISLEGDTINLANTIIANNSASYGPSNDDCTYDDANTTIGITATLIGTGFCSEALGGPNLPASLSGDPLLGSLANNGGPTQTFALLAGSNAIDAGDNTICDDNPGPNNLDQRGITRPNGVLCDIGAYEYVDTTAPTVTAFAATSPSNSLNIPITTFTASDDATVAGYKVTTSSTPPSAGAAGWTVSAPTTYTVGSDGAYTLYPWVKDATSHVSALFGSPASVTVDTGTPTVISSVRANTSPTAKTSVQFTVTFSESVTGVSTADFSLTTTGVSGTSITSVSADSGSTRTVTVSTGSGNGTIRLNVPNTATISDLAGNSLSGLPFTSGQVYTVNKTLTYMSTGSLDGWILESTETSNAGGTLNATGATFLLGDAAVDKQYRSILSFNTASLPDNANITSITLKIRRPTTGFLTGNNNPFTWGLGLKADVCKSMFGTTSALQLSDFNYNNTTNCKLLAAAFSSTPSLNWYSANLLSTAFAKVNKTGLTQFRLRFAKDDNDDGLADYLSFYSGNAAAANRPQLVITYSVP